MGLKNLKYFGSLGFYLYYLLFKVYRYIKFDRLSDQEYISSRFLKTHGYPLDLDNPKTLNEKLQWLKLNDRRDLYTVHADKYGVRAYIQETFGDEYLVPMVLITDQISEVKPENLPNYPTIIKATHDSGSFRIVRDKHKVDWQKLRIDCKWWLSQNYYYADREWQYQSIKPQIIIEKLLATQDGFIPNDYKVNCFNGKVGFIYVSVDREGDNKRNIYDSSWNPLLFTWGAKYKDHSLMRGKEIEPPKTLSKMIEISESIAKNYAYVRVDFYDVDGHLYVGEITHCHGGGFDVIRPIEWDYMLGEKLDLSQYGFKQKA